MIIRILNEGQYKLEGDALMELDRYDDSLLDAIEDGDETAYTARFQEVLNLIRRQNRIPDSELLESDLILPAPETTLTEARKLFANYPRNLV